MWRRIALLAALGASLATGAAVAAEVEVKMLNRGSDGGIMVFEPALVRVAPGDTVRFVASNPTHDAASIPKMLPDGAQPFAGKMDQDLVVTLTEPGVYGVKCSPHYPLGMVALIVVGDDLKNLETAKAVTHPGKAKAAFAALFNKLAASGQ